MTDQKVTVKPSEEIVTAANKVEFVTAGDMKIGLKKPGILEQFDIVEVLGETAQNTTYMQMVMPILWVVEINGEPQARPGTKRELRALIQRLGEDGIAAVMNHLVSKANANTESDSVKN